jgi:glycogen synthase
MGEPRRVLMTTDTVGGVFTYAVSLARELSKTGIDVHLATMGPAPRAEQRAWAREIEGLVLHESTWALEWMDDPWEDVARAGDWLVSLEREVAPDVVHLNGYAHGTVDFQAPKIVVAHSCVFSWWHAVLDEAPPPRYEAYRTAVRAGIAGADAVVAVSAAMRASLEDHYGPIPHAEVVHNGSPPARTGDAPKEPFVLSCGRTWDRAKNVAALARVARRLPWPVKIVGWEADPCSGLSSLGWLAPRDLGRLMERASVFALPARYEPFGLSALEAAQRGAALVLGDIQSQREIWDDAALFVDPTDEDALAGALTQLALDESLRADLGARARERAALYTASRTATQTLDVYRSAIRGRGRVSEAAPPSPRGSIQCA